MSKTLYVPKHLQADQKAAWKSIVPELLKTDRAHAEDAHLLEQLACAWAEVLRAETGIQEEGYVVKSINKNGAAYMQPNPWVSIRDKAFDRFLKIADRFGMSPGARKKLNESVALAAAGNEDIFQAVWK